jgi:hypothetical protein
MSPAAKRGAKKPGARKVAAKKVAKKKPAKKLAATKSRGKKKRPIKKKPSLQLVKRAAPRPAKKKRVAAKPFAGAIASASAKDLALFDLVRARVELSAAFQGMTAASAEIPVAEGKWSPRQVVLHVYYWDREMLPWVEKAYQRRVKPPHTMDDILAENETSQTELAGHDWETAKRMLQQAREALIESLQSLPEEPAEMWTSEHPLGWLMRILAKHDRHHAARLKESRTTAAPVPGGTG